MLRRLRSQLTELLTAFGGVSEARLAVFDGAGVLLVASSGSVVPEGGLAALSATGAPSKTILVAGEVQGTIVLLDGQPAALDFFTKMMTELTKQRFQLADMSMAVLENFKEINVLHAYSTNILTILDQGEVLRRTLAEALKLAGAATGVIFLRDPSGEVISATDIPADAAEADWLAAGIEALARQTVASGREKILNKVGPGAVELTGKSDEWNHSFLSVPIMAGEDTVGAIVLADKTKGDFSSIDLRFLLTLANPAGKAVENAQLYGALESAFLNTCRSLAEAIEKRDPYTGGHAKRVMEYSMALARQIGLPDEDLKRLQLAAILHDVGKIGVDDSVLRKPGRLTDDEFDQMKRHPVIGGEILAPIPQLKPMLPGVLYHHERYDGLGYPFNMSGEGIPFMARLIALADTYDAMTSTRPYRRGLDHSIASDEIRKNLGTQFDPELGLVFANELTGEQLRDRWQDEAPPIPADLAVPEGLLRPASIPRAPSPSA